MGKEKSAAGLGSVVKFVTGIFFAALAIYNLYRAFRRFTRAVRGVKG
jgi:hypothetical protein